MPTQDSYDALSGVDQYSYATGFRVDPVSGKLTTYKIPSTLLYGGKWTTGNGIPSTPGVGPGDQYLNMSTGDVYSWNATAGTWGVGVGTLISGAYQIPVWCNGAPLNGEVLQSFEAPAPYYLNQNLPGSVASAKTAATATAVFSLTRNGTQIGTCTFAAGSALGTYSFAANVTMVTGDVLELVAPATADATLAGIRFTIVGARPSAAAQSDIVSATNAAVSAAAAAASAASIAPFLSAQPQYIFTATAGQTTWTPPGGITFQPGAAQVYVNGVRWNRTESFDDSSGNHISFVNPLVLGVSVTVLLMPTVVYPVTGASISDLATAVTGKGSDMVGFLGANGIATTVSGLASGLYNKGGALVGYLPLGTGAISRNVTAKLQETVSVRDFGAVNDFNGTTGTDNYAAFTAAMNSGAARVLIPGSGYYLGTGIVVPDKVTLEGEAMLSGDNITAGQPPAGTVLWFATSVMKCVTLTAGVYGQTAAAKKMVVARVGTPPSGSTAYYVNQGRKVIMEDLYAYNHARAYSLYASSPAGLGAMMTNVFASNITENYWYIDGWPELRVRGGRMGGGTGDSTSANAFIYITATGTQGGGMGPNTFAFENYHFNSGGGTSNPQYFIDVENVNMPAGNQGVFSFTDCYVENIATAVIKSGIGAGYFKQTTFTACTFNCTAAPFFALAAGTLVSQLAFFGCNIYTTTFALAPNQLMSSLNIVGGTINGAASITGAAGLANGASILGTTFAGGLTLAGSWSDLYVRASGTLTNTAQGIAAGSNLNIRLGTINFDSIGTDNKVSYSATGAGYLLKAQVARGTAAVPTASSTNDVTSAWASYAHDGTNFQRIGQMRWAVGGTVSTGVVPGSLIFSVSNAAGAFSDVLQMDRGGNFAPLANNAQDTGSATFAWRSVYGTKFYSGGTQVVSSQVTGYGTPTGNSRTASFNGASATLAQTSAQLAQLIVDLKAHGLLGA